MIMQTVDRILSSTLECYRVTVRFCPVEDVRLESWVGAVFRNRFLYFAESVYDEDGISLRSHLDKLPLSSQHAFYKQLKGGFPKGVLFDFRDIPDKSRNGILYKDRIYSFQIVLIGKFVSQFPLVVQTLIRMCTDGIGHPLVPLNLIDIVERMENEEYRLLYSVNTASMSIPQNAIRICDFRDDMDTVELCITFHTPLSLYQVKEKVCPELSYQYKMNGFPSFYQLIRSASYRWAILAMLYGQEMEEIDKKELEQELDKWVEAASLAVLQDVSLHYRKIYGTPKKMEKHVYVMGGYEGQLVWRNVPGKYLPLLLWGMHLAVGDNVQYGMGTYSIEMRLR